MKKDDDLLKINKKTTSKLMSGIQNLMNKMYSNTFLSPYNLSKDTEDIKQGLKNSFDNILQNNDNEYGIKDISSIYNRVITNNKKSESNGDFDTSGELEKLFSGNDITQTMNPTFMKNRYLREYDEEIDLMCKYDTFLIQALNIKQSHVLSADRFSLDFLNVYNSQIEGKDDELRQFNEKIQEYKKKYKLIERVEDYVKRASKYGEEYVYITSYKEGFSKLINSMNKSQYIKESTIDIPLNEINSSIEKNNAQYKGQNIEVKLEMSYGLLSAVKNKKDISVFTEATNKMDTVIPDKVSFETNEKLDSTANEGLFTNKDKVKSDDIKAIGCIIKRLKRENLIPIYIDDENLGYFYVECSQDPFSEAALTGYGVMNSLTAMNRMQNNMLNLLKTQDEDNFLNIVCKKISKVVDASFINNNQDIADELYAILSHNINNDAQLKVNISYLPNKDVVAFIFNKDPITHRGLSDLDASLIPGKLYASLYVTNTLGILTRGFDKRVYYVKQQVDTNISQNLINTITQIKKANFGSREVVNLKNTLNMTGRYNDFVIPMNSNGDYPINFEIMQGQDIDTKQELMDSLKSLSLGPTDVPMEMIESENTQIELATRLTMVNQRFLISIYHRQAQLNPILSKFMNRIWEIEEGDSSCPLYVKLTPPTYLELTNAAQTYDYTVNYARLIGDVEGTGKSDDVKGEFVKQIVRYKLQNELDIKKLDEFMRDAEMKAKTIIKSDDM